MKAGVDEPQAADVATVIIQTNAWYGPWLSVGAILVSAAIGATIALYSISEQRKIARKRATLDMLAKKEWDRDYIDARAEFIKLRDASSGLELWATEEHRNSPQSNTIRNTLNDYELIAVGIRERILDEDLYKRWFRTSFLKDWRAARRFVLAIRAQAGTDAIFAEMDWLAHRWGEPVQQPLPLAQPEAKP
ncbi:MAG: hypothetical protein COW75_02175 [Rhodobacterales bacterium CG18_big_fil_WC_8_21_14_2_50_71_9]|nr:MAG: hypothetical protein COW75_02175 [Rhodobacterales bacterium CG18_big_fil_WC_8_21_14_2_50_71_9]PIY73088.1 MAG: hypothetical protein COY86_08450 [Rhodobacterales bacterium CG_4_10_14_0_8_um_filter_70_9]PJA61037.1 MAG: hypothetical protein CO163_00340 [Rhodobacterales bacterium CG_4_9_14_3_um_filter_71_31]